MSYPPSSGAPQGGYSLPSPNYTPQHHGTQPQSAPNGYGGPPRPPGPKTRNYGVIGAIVIGCTALVLTSVLLITLSATSGNGDDETNQASATSDIATETTVESDAPSEEAVEETEATETAETAEATIDTGDPEAVAVAVVEILYGFRDESAKPYLCSRPQGDLAYVDITADLISEYEFDAFIDEFVSNGTTAYGSDVLVEVDMVIFGANHPVGTITAVEENGEWRACDLEFAEGN